MLSLKREGLLWRELIGPHKWQTLSEGKITRREHYFPGKTLDRHLKRLIEKGFVERVLEPRKEGERGRQSTRYRIPEKYWHSWGFDKETKTCDLLVSYVPAKWIGKAWFPGKKISRLDTKFVRLSSEERVKFEKQKAWMKEHQPQEYDKWLKLERLKRKSRRQPRLYPLSILP